ncbi:hypothetical protein IMZ48_12520 [Candidatus Bathyarchaeota archaeon]|nr:hypothetical protein [Candidatus Bathyarchaeota archaeon]
MEITTGPSFVGKLIARMKPDIPSTLRNITDDPPKPAPNPHGADATPICKGRLTNHQPLSSLPI